MADLSPIMLANFWGRVTVSDPGSCWEWRGRRKAKGYGLYQGYTVHRLAYQLVNGDIPEGQLLRHVCDNPSCCNPRHLLPGTAKDNARDAVERGRNAAGERHGNTRLTQADVTYIRQNPEKKTGRELAQTFKVAPSTISYIRNGRSWR